MTTKVLNIVKTTLLAATLCITSLAAFPQMSKAWTIEIDCDGSQNTCAIIDGVAYNLGNWTEIRIYPN